jgi:Flp pilus assembly pilin Flp
MRLAHLRRRIDDRGSSTVEYALVAVAGAAFAVLLAKLLTGPKVTGMLGDLLARALSGVF